VVSASSFPIRTVEEITAGFPVEKIPPVVGKPNLPELMRVQEIIRQCAMTICETGGPFGMLYLVKPANVYTALTNIPFYPPLLPPNQPQTCQSCSPPKSLVSPPSGASPVIVITTTRMQIKHSLRSFAHRNCIQHGRQHRNGIHSRV
jgi:hypothetical protein